MKSLGMRAVVIALCLLAITLFLSSAAKASNQKQPVENPSFIDLTERIFALPGCEAHRRAYQKIYIGMDAQELGAVIKSLAAPDKELIEASREDADHTNIMVVWTWVNKRTDAGIETEEISAIKIRMFHNKVVGVIFKYDSRSPDTMSEEIKSKGSRSFIEAQAPPAKPPQEKK